MLTGAASVDALAAGIFSFCPTFSELMDFNPFKEASCFTVVPWDFAIFSKRSPLFTV